MQLDVPFEEKDQAKALGAKWDAQARAWFVPEGADPLPFARWFPRDLEAPGGEGTMSADSFALITGKVSCWKCRKDTRATTVLLRGYQEIEDGQSEVFDQDAVLNPIVGLDPATRALFASEAPWMRPGYTKTRDQIYLAAHCEHCDALQGAWFLTEPGSAFFPQSLADASRLSVQWFQEPIEVVGSPNWSSWTDWIEGP